MQSEVCCDMSTVTNLAVQLQETNKVYLLTYLTCLSDGYYEHQKTLPDETLSQRAEQTIPAKQVQSHDWHDDKK